jgi:hypothetical protein
MRLLLKLSLPLLVILCLSAVPKGTPDLRRIGQIADKGRVQDRDYNRTNPVIEQLIALRLDAIPLLIARLTDTTVIPKPPVNFWPQVTVGDVALLILSDFFLTSTGEVSTVPGPGLTTSSSARARMCLHGRHWRMTLRPMVDEVFV